MNAAYFDIWRSHPDRRDQRWELVKGTPVERPWATGKMTGFLAASLLTELAVYGRLNGGEALDGPPLLVADATVRVAEMAYMMNRQLIVVVDADAPNDRPGDGGRRAAEYLQGIAAAVWWVEPRARTVTTFTAAGARTLGLTDDLTHEALPGFACPLSELFQTRPT